MPVRLRQASCSWMLVELLKLICGVGADCVHIPGAVVGFISVPWQWLIYLWLFIIIYKSCDSGYRQVGERAINTNSFDNQHSQLSSYEAKRKKLIKGLSTVPLFIFYIQIRAQYFSVLWTSMNISMFILNI